MSRRRALAIAMGAGFLSATGVYWGLGSVFAGDSEPDPRAVPSPPDDAEVRWRLRLAHRFADGPVQRLVDSHATYIWIVDQYGLDDPVLVQGLVRLSKFALLDRGEHAAGIARHIIRTYELKAPPNALGDYFPKLEDLLRERRMRRR